MSELRILSIIPPMTQLNTPYPSTAYLTGFLRSRGFHAQQADLLLFNGNIITGWADKPVVKSVAIRDGKFVAVGKEVPALRRVHDFVCGPVQHFMIESFHPNSNAFARLACHVDSSQLTTRSVETI